MLGRRTFLALASAVGLAGCSRQSTPEQQQSNPEESMTDRSPEFYDDETEELTADVSNQSVSTDEVSVTESLTTPADKWSVQGVESVGPSDTIDSWTDDGGKILANDTSYDSEEAKAPTPVLVDGTVYLYYLANNGSTEQIALATHDNPDTLDPSGWTKYSGNPVLTPGDYSWIDSHTSPVSTPVWTGSEYLMLVTGVGPGEFQIGYATSTDLVSWTLSSSPVIPTGSNGATDSKNATAPTLIRVGNELHAFYAGQGPIGQHTLHHAYTTTDDIDNWTKDPENPVLAHGTPGSTDDTRIFGTEIYYDEGVFHLLYDGDDGTTRRLHYAVSTDLRNWSRQGVAMTVPDYCEETTMPKPLNIGGRIELFYEPINGSVSGAQSGHATLNLSPKGVK